MSARSQERGEPPYARARRARDRFGHADPRGSVRARPPLVRAGGPSLVQGNDHGPALPIRCIWAICRSRGDAYTPQSVRPTPPGTGRRHPKRTESPIASQVPQSRDVRHFTHLECRTDLGLPPGTESPPPRTAPPNRQSVHRISAIYKMWRSGPDASQNGSISPPNWPRSTGRRTAANSWQFRTQRTFLSQVPARHGVRTSTMTTAASGTRTGGGEAGAPLAGMAGSAKRNGSNTNGRANVARYGTGRASGHGTFRHRRRPVERHLPEGKQAAVDVVRGCRP